MTRREHPIDAHVRRLPLLSDEQAAEMSSPAAKQALLERITAMPVITDAPPTGSHTPSARRLPRRTLVLATILATLSVAAVGGAAVTWLAQDTTTVACHTNETSVTVVSAVTGDPVMDCQAAWRDMGSEPPELAAYDNGRGGIEVIPASATPEPGWEPLGAGVVQDRRVLELDAALNDVGSGLPSDCHLLPEARTIAEAQLERLGLDGWSVTSERGEADGTSTCSFYYLDPARQQVVLIPLEGVDASDGPFPAYARDLAAAFTERCSTTQAAAQTARDLAAAAGIADMGLTVQEVTDETVDCARSNVNVGGRVEVIIRGPATP